MSTLFGPSNQKVLRQTLFSPTSGAYRPQCLQHNIKVLHGTNNKLMVFWYLYSLMSIRGCLSWENHSCKISLTLHRGFSSQITCEALFFLRVLWVLFKEVCCWVVILGLIPLLVWEQETLLVPLLYWLRAKCLVWISLGIAGDKTITVTLSLIYMTITDYILFGCCSNMFGFSGSNLVCITVISIYSVKINLVVHA